MTEWLTLSLSLTLCLASDKLLEDSELLNPSKRDRRVRGEVRLPENVFSLGAPSCNNDFPSQSEIGFSHSFRRRKSTFIDSFHSKMWR